MRASSHRVGVLVTFAAVFAGCAAFAGPAIPPAYGTSSFFQTSLDLDLAIDYDRPAVSGTATLTLINRGTEPSGEVPLLLNRLMSIREVHDAAGRKLPVRAAVTIFEDEPLRQVMYARIALPAPIARGRTVALKIVYGGALTGYADAGNLYVKDRIDRRFTILREDALAFPRIGVPSARVNYARPREDFAFHARVTVPDGQVVASAGHLVDRRSSGGGRTTFEFTGDPVPFLNIAIAPYRRIERDAVQVYALPDDEAKAADVVEAVRQTLARLEAWYGPLATAPRITIIEIPDGFGSQASRTAGIILEAVVFRDRNRLLDLYHELTHFWNPPDLDVPPVRWTEGLARYLEYRLGRELDGFSGTARVLERTRARVCDASLAPALRRTAFVQYGRSALSDNSYDVGMLMFSALEAVVGPETLDAGLRAHVQTYFTRGSTADQMVASLKQAAAPVDLTDFFRDWMFTSGWVDRVCPAPSFAEAVASWRRR